MSSGNQRAMAQLFTADESPTAAVEFDSVVRRFGRTEVLHGLSFSVARGTICGLLAPSGGGKTTTLRLITGVHAPTSGSVRVLGSAPSSWTREQRRRLGYMPQQFVLYPELTVRRNLSFMAGIYGLASRAAEARIGGLLTMVGLVDAADRPAGRLSGGMQRRLQLAATLLHDPELLVIDEPTAGIDPLLRARFWEHFRALRNRGRTLIVSTQYVTEAEHCDQVVILGAGKVVGCGTPDELRRAAFGDARGGTDGRERNFEEVFLQLMRTAERAS